MNNSLQRHIKKKRNFLKISQTAMTFPTFRSPFKIGYHATLHVRAHFSSTADCFCSEGFVLCSYKSTFSDRILIRCRWMICTYIFRFAWMNLFFSTGSVIASISCVTFSGVFDASRFFSIQNEQKSVFHNIYTYFINRSIIN